MSARIAIAIVIACIVSFAAGWIARPLATPYAHEGATVTLTRIVTSVESTTARGGSKSVAACPLSSPSTITITRTVTVASRLRSACLEAPKVVLVLEHQYPKIVTQLIDRANRSVYVMMFAMKYYPWERNDVDAAINALCAAAHRGVDVRVLVDYVTAKEYGSTIRHLESCGVKVKVWHECDGLWKLHAKVVIVDGKYVVLGSHNWTYSAFNHNIEVSVEIESAKIASKLTSLFLELWRSACSVAPQALSS
ncbi:MAG: hypothetical protein GXO32_02875 [Crenarchaeota archaeon]|nr:hypothetical protein [Thermoproteota archaeon]